MRDQTRFAVADASCNISARKQQRQQRQRELQEPSCPVSFHQQKRQPRRQEASSRSWPEEVAIQTDEDVLCKSRGKGRRRRMLGSVLVVTLSVLLVSARQAAVVIAVTTTKTTTTTLPNASPASVGSSNKLRGAMEAPYPIPENLRPPEVASTREQRFPSVEERVKLYMSNWYVPPCPSYSKGKIRYRYNGSNSTAASDVLGKNSTWWPTLSIEEPDDRSGRETYVLESAIEPDKCFFLHRPTLLECAREEVGDAELARRVTAAKNMYLYCTDVADSLLTARDHVLWEKSWDDAERSDITSNDVSNTPPPILLQFGDLRHSHKYGFTNLPHVKKFRSRTTREEILRVTGAGTASSTQQCLDRPRSLMATSHNHMHLQPIVWKLATSRHFRLLYKVYREDTPWRSKTDAAVFRGQLTGSLDGYDKTLSDEENCFNMRRCRLVYNHANSTLVHARLTSTRNRMPAVLRSVDLMGPKVTIRKLLQYKGIIMLEGNDVASGLKWALLSQSVVLMPEPKHTSWAMEELLEPWVHYIPLNENATDVEEKMRWVVENDEHAQRISERASLWMQDLVFHPDAAEDDRLIQEEIMRRYFALFDTLPQHRPADSVTSASQ